MNSNFTHTNLKKAVYLTVTNKLLLLSLVFLAGWNMVWGQTYDANTTWTVPSNGTIMVEAWGGGGSGGCGQRSAGTSRGGGGGSGGNYAKKNSFSVSAGDVIVISIGNGGAGSSSGGDGGTTTVTIGSTTIISVAGGLKGGNAPTNDNGTAAQTNFTSSSCSGGCDVTTWGNAGTKADPGRGGGAGNGGGQQTANASTGTIPGGGGSGRNGSGTTNGVKCNGGSGRGGRVIISFTGTPSPTIIGFTPSSVCASSSATVTITGTNFTGATAVSIGGTAAAAYTVNSATQITATVGAGTTGQISVTTPGGTATSSGTLTVNTKPPTPAANNNSRCGTGTVAISVTTGINGTITWFSDINLTTQVASMSTDASGTTQWTTPSISSTTTYYATRTNLAGCASNGVAVTATVNTNPAAPTSPVNYTGCAGIAAMSVSVPFTSLVDWYTDVALTNSAFQANATGTISYSPILSSSQTYYVTRTAPSTGCRGPATTVTATINSDASAGTVIAGTTPQCIGSTSTYTVSGAVLSGGTGAWSSSDVNVATVNSSTGVVTAVGAGTCNIIYTVTGGCGGTKTSSAAYTVHQAITGLTSTPSANPVCEGSSLSFNTSFTAGSNITWSWSGQNFTSSSQSPTVTANASSANAGTYVLTASNACNQGGVNDNFSDNNYTSNPVWTVQQGAFLSTSYLKGDNNSNTEIISTSSSQAYGSWQFDYIFDAITSGNNGATQQFVTYFLISSAAGLQNSNGYYVYVDGGGTLALRRRNGGSAATTLINSTHSPDLSAHTIKVTRSVNGLFELFFDGVSKGTFTDNTYTTSSFSGTWMFGVFTSDNHIVDNIICNEYLSVVNAITVATKPAAPGSDTHTPAATQIVWNWNTVSGATGYKYSTTNNYATATDNGTSTTYTQTGLSCGTSYNLYVWAYNANCNSTETTLTASTASCCVAPTNLNYTAGNTIYCLNAAIEDNVPSNDGGTPTLYSINGTLPTGLSFNTTTGIISGTPTALAAVTTYTITASNSCGSTQKDITITVIDIPTSVSAVASPNPLCENATLTLTGSATNATTWSWAGPDNFSSIDQSPTISNLSVAAAGVYTLTAGNICGSATAVSTASVTVNAAPTSTANGFVPAICQGGTTVALGGTFGGSATSAIWSDGVAGGTFTNNDGSTPNTTTYTPASNAPSLITLTLTTSGGSCGSAVVDLQIVVNTSPTVNAGGAVAAVCQGRSSAVLDGSFSGGATMAIWSDGGAGGTFANNNGSTPGTTTYTPALNAPSTVTLTLTADAGSCGTVSASKQITVNPTPTITAIVSGSRCDAGTVTISAMPSSGSINWFANSSGGISLNSGNFYTTPSISSTTSYWAEAVAGSCVSLQRIEVAATVNSSPTVNAGSALSSICQGGTSAALGGSVGGGATGGVWSDGGIGGSFVPVATDLNAQWIPPTNYSGTATLTLTTLGATSPCTNVAASKNIVVTAGAIANAGANQSVGASEPAQLNGSVTNATGGTWTSNIAGTFTPNANTLNASWLPNDPLFIGTAILTLTTTGATSPCSNVSDVVNITVATPSICSGSTGSGTATFTGGSGGTGDAINEYEVSTNNGSTWAAYTPPNAINIAGATGSVQVRARRKDTGCVDSDWNTYVLWYVLDRPTVDNINGETVCLNIATTPITVSASGNSGTLSYQWYQNSTNSTTGGTPISGATTSVYTPSSLTLGTTYYYNTVGYQGFSGCDATTNAAAITINGPSVADLAANDWLWTGRSNTNWEAPVNWLRYDGNNTFSVVSSLPASTNNVMIKTGDCINSDVTVNATETNPLSVNAASANNVTIRNGASLSSLNGNNNIRLHVYGNWLNEGMFYCNIGSVFFNGSGNQTITSKWGNSTTLPAPSGVSFYNLLINNSGSSGGFKVSTLDNLNVLNLITVTNGNFDIGSNRAYSKKVNNIGNINIGSGGQMRVNE